MFDVNKYPYTDFHELNLDWVIKKVQELGVEVTNFINFNKIKYADPLQWAIDRNYEANTIVVNGTESYLSIKPVPSGVDINNTDYWILVGNFQEDIREIKSEIADINTRLNSIDNRKFIFISDSYGEEREGTSWHKELADMMGLTQNVDYYEGHQGGCGFVARGLTYLDVLKGTYSTSVPYIDDKKSITDIIVITAFNDSQVGKVQLLEGIKTFMDYVKITYPNAKVHLFACGWSQNWEITSGSQYSTYLTYVKEGIQYGLGFCTGSELIMHNSEYFLPEPDASYTGGNILIHPNAKGSKAIARGILQYLKEGSVSVNYPLLLPDITPATTSNYIVTQLPTMGEWLANEQVYWSVLDGTIAFDRPITLEFPNRIKIGHINNGYFIGTQDSFQTITCPLVVHSSTGYTLTSGSLMFDKGDLYINVAYLGECTRINVQACNGIFNPFAG